MQSHPGKDVASLRALTIALAKDAIFGKEELTQSYLSGRKEYSTLDTEKLDYIKSLVRSRVSDVSSVEFKHMW